MPVLLARQDNGEVPPGWVVEDGIARPWWYSRTGYIVKWTILLSLTGLIFLYLIGGYLHGKRRIRKGLMPMRYHRWLMSRRDLARVDPRYAYPQPAYANYPPPNYYNMQPMPPPPVYEPPAGGTKVDPSQWRTEPTRRPQENFEAPPGPPPSQTTMNTGESNNPYRQ